MTASWRPSATLPTLRARADLLQAVRAFFVARGALEVDVPTLGAAPVTDPHLHALTTDLGGRLRYLQTSPEYYLKRLLAAGCGDCFYLGKAFRAEEHGRRHNPEFTLLEWYRLGWDERQLGQEVLALCQALLGDRPVRVTDYRSLFQQHFDLDPHRADLATLQDRARQAFAVAFDDPDPTVWLDLLFSHGIEPTLDGLTLVHDYPAPMAALARVTDDALGQPVARRFEVFVDGMELANGYWELTDAAEQRRRFQRDLDQRAARGLAPVPVDDALLAALAAGLPDCAGVALGIDRLLMAQQGCNHIDQVLPFADC